MKYSLNNCKFLHVDKTVAKCNDVFKPDILSLPSLNFNEVSGSTTTFIKSNSLVGIFQKF